MGCLLRTVSIVWFMLVPFRTVTASFFLIMYIQFFKEADVVTGNTAG